MKITNAGVFLTCPGRNFVILKIETDQGVVGYGDGTLNGREKPVVSYLQDCVIPMLIGMDPRRIEDVWQLLCRRAYWRGGPGAVAYAASKGAVMTLTRGLAKEQSPRIRINAICPGMINTDFHNIFTKDEARKNFAAATPLKREGRTDEVGNLAAHLASDEASFITTANIDIRRGNHSIVDAVAHLLPICCPIQISGQQIFKSSH